MIQGMAHFARNELELAEHFLSQDLPLQHNTNLFLMSGYPARAYAQLAQGNSAKAHETVGQALALCTLAQIEHRRISPWVRRFLLAHQARLWLLEGKAEATTEWIQTLVTSCAGEHAASGPPTLLAEWEGIVLARARIATGEFQGALDLLETLGTQAAAASRIGRLLEILVLQAVAYARQSDAGRALDALRPALRLAEPEAAVRVFVEGGPLIQHLLELERAAPTQEKSLSPAENQPRVVDFVALLLAAFQPVKSGAADHELTEREVEVLRLLAGGAADKEIARVLRVALGTVKRHTNKIYMKLGVQSRTQAITRADALEIIKR
jgi:LuxR family maltose regulon positive regulatory protein